MKNFKFIYDREVDSLLVYREDRKPYASIKFGEIIISLDKHYNISAIEILNPDLLYGIPKKKLSQISDAFIQVQQRGQVLWIFILLKFKNLKETEKLPLPLQLEKPISV